MAATILSVGRRETELTTDRNTAAERWGKGAPIELECWQYTDYVPLLRAHSSQLLSSSTRDNLCSTGACYLLIQLALLLSLF